MDYLIFLSGKVESGVVSIGDKIKVLSPDGKTLIPDAKVIYTIHTNIQSYTYTHTLTHTYIQT